ncbi:MAG: hypothetical protein ABJA10_07810, partial [Aestuariivirga sp.]
RRRTSADHRRAFGHAHSAKTQRYAHLSDDPLRAASEAVGNRISAPLKSGVTLGKRFNAV